MRSLFATFLFWFWVCLVVVIGSELFLEARSLQEGLALVPGGGPGTIGQHADQARVALARGGMAALDSVLAAMRDEGMVDPVVVETGGGPPGAGLPDGARRAGLAALRTHSRMVVETPRGIYVGYPLSLYGGGTRALVLHPVRGDQDGEGSPIEWLRFLPFDMLVRAVTMLLLGGLGAYLLARSITAPVARLQQATRRLASGDLGARVGSSRSPRRDELERLGRDFDQMADRIETLVSAQRRLFGDVSHELRSPLARLNLAVGVLRQRGMDDPMLARIETEAGRLDRLIEDVLTLTRIESGDVGPAPEPVDLAALAGEIAEDARFEAGTRSCTVRLVRAGPVVVTGTRTLLRSALENVVRNAIRHTAEASEVEVSVSAEARDGALEALVLVRDHGPGLPAHQLERIFEPFYRVDDARTREAGGYGLGLAIARRAVQRHGGRIAAGLAPGGGLVVTIRLPATAPAA